jgi:hypothetical protein
MEVKKGIVISSIMPNNERVKKKLEIEKLREEERQRLEDDRKKKALEEYNIEELLRKQQQEDDKMKKMQEQQSLEQDTKLRQTIINKMVCDFSSICSDKLSIIF